MTDLDIHTLKKSIKQSNAAVKQAFSHGCPIFTHGVSIYIHPMNINMESLNAFHVSHGKKNIDVSERMKACLLVRQSLPQPTHSVWQF
jgi:hypothetical protein